MKFAEWFDGQRITKKVLDWLNLSRTEEISDKEIDRFQDGVMSNRLNEFALVGKDTDVSLSDFFHIAIRSGIAYKNGNRIAITNASETYDATNINDTSDNGLGVQIPTPHSTGCFDIPLTAGSINYLYIAYLQATDESEFSSHKITRVRQFYKRVDGYQIVVNTTGLNPDVNEYLYLGLVDLTGSNQAVSGNIFSTNRETFGLQLQTALVNTPQVSKVDRTTNYGFGETYFIDDHTRAVGSGDVTATNPHGLRAVDIGAFDIDMLETHQRYLHSSGIVGSNVTTASSLYPFIVTVEPTGADYIVVRKLAVGEVVLVDGTMFTWTDFGSDSQVTFDLADPSGVYYVYLDKATVSFMKTQTDLITNPDPAKFLICTVVWTSPGDGGPLDGDLTDLIDRRKFGTTSDDLIQTVMTLTLSVYASDTTMTYSPTANNLLTSTTTGFDSKGVPFTYTVTNTYTPGNDDANAELASSIQTYSYDTTALNVTSTYTYDGNGNLIQIETI